MNENILLTKINLIPSQDIKNFIISKYHVGIAVKTINTTKTKNDINYFFNHLTEIINNKLIESISLLNITENFENDLINSFSTFKKVKLNANKFLNDFIEYFNIKED